MSLGTRIKDPADIRLYTIDWSEWLDGATISSSTWSLASGLTNVTDANTTTTATVKISGGSNGHSYACANTITTSAGETRKVSFDLEIETQ